MSDTSAVDSKRIQTKLTAVMFIMFLLAYALWVAKPYVVIKCTMPKVTQKLKEVEKAIVAKKIATGNWVQSLQELGDEKYLAFQGKPIVYHPDSRIIDIQLELDHPSLLYRATFGTLGDTGMHIGCMLKVPDPAHIGQQ